MGADVVITGLGVVSPCGDSPAALHAALARAGDGHVVAPGQIDRLGGGFGYEVGGFVPEAYLGPGPLAPMDRAGLLLASAVALALGDSGWTATDLAGTDVGLAVGTMFSTVGTIGRFDRHAQTAGPAYASPLDFANTVLNAPAGQAAIRHGLRGPNTTVAAGAASSLRAISLAADLIRTGRATAVVAGGFEELTPEWFGGFRRSGRLSGPSRPLPFDSRRAGFAPAEGAAVLVLERAEAAAARGAPVLARVAAHGERFDPSRGEDDPSATGAMTEAMRAAVAGAGLGPRDVDCVSASARGDRTGDDREARALATLFESADPAVTAVKAVAGEALGAGGAVQAVATVMAMTCSEIPGVPALPEHPFLRGRTGPATRARTVRHALVNSFGFDGHCSSLVLSGGPDPEPTAVRYS